MATGKQINISALYADLSRFGTNGDYDRALKTCNKILHEFPEEDKAFHCKVVCFIQLSKFQEAIQFLGKNAKIAAGLLFEKAYCQYRLNQPQEALKTVNSAQIATPKLKELKAQILYRLEEFEDCFDVYRDIIKNTTDDYEDERETNLAAVVSNLTLNGSKREMPSLRESTYELMYNAACKMIGSGSFVEAEKKLRQSEKMCREMLEEDGTADEDIEDELGIVRVQLGYCLQNQGREKEAQVIYNAALKQKPDDIALVAVASNNQVTLNREQNVFDSKKKLRNATTEGLENKLTTLQRRIIAINHCLLTGLTGTADQCTTLCEKTASLYPSESVNLALIRATALAREGKLADTAKLLQQQAKQSPGSKLDLQLAAVQLYLNEGDRKGACKILRDLGEHSFSAGVVSALVTLYLSEDDRGAASSVLKDAVDWYKKNKTSKQGNLGMLWRQAADFHLRGGEPKVAASSLEELLRLHPSDTKTLAQLVIAYSQFDPRKAKELSKKLPAVSELTQAPDVDALETSSWVMGTKVMKKVKVEQGAMSGGDSMEQKKKKKRKRRPGPLPKNYVIGVTPDPERWLPRYERSGYRKKKDRRVKEVLKGSQGTAVGSSEQYDMSARAAQIKASPSSPDQGAIPKTPRGKPQKKKGGKKGGKW